MTHQSANPPIRQSLDAAPLPFIEKSKMEVTLVPVASETLKVASLRDETAGKLPCSSTLEWAGHVQYYYGYICKQPSAYAAHSTLQSCANGVSWLRFNTLLCSHFVFTARFCTTQVKVAAT